MFLFFQNIKSQIEHTVPGILIIPVIQCLSQCVSVVSICFHICIHQNIQDGIRQFYPLIIRPLSIPVILIRQRRLRKL